MGTSGPTDSEHRQRPGYTLLTPSTSALNKILETIAIKASYRYKSGGVAKHKWCISTTPRKIPGWNSNARHSGVFYDELASREAHRLGSKSAIQYNTRQRQKSVQQSDKTSIAGCTELSLGVRCYETWASA